MATKNTVVKKTKKAQTKAATSKKPRKTTKVKPPATPLVSDSANYSHDPKISELEQELKSTREYLQSVNEELATINANLQTKVDELTFANNDIKNLMENTQVGVIFLDTKLHIRRFTHASKEIVDLIPEDIGRPLKQFVHKLRYDRLIQDAQETLKTQVVKEVEVQTEGDAWYLLRIMPYRTVDEQISGVVLTFADITQVKQAETSLRESEEKYRNLYNNAEVAMFRTKLDGSGFIEANEKLCDIIGFKREELIGRPTSINWAEPAERAEMVRRLKAGEHVKNFEWKLLTKSGEVRNCLTSLKLYAEDGILEGSFIDITERKRAEEALRQSEEKFRAISSSTPDHILMQNIDLRYEFVVNPQLGLTEQDILGKTDHDFLPKEDADHLTRIKKQVLESGKPIHLEIPVRSRDGAQGYFEGSYMPKFDSDGTVAGLIGYFKNVTARKQAEEALRESEERFRLSLKNAPVTVAAQDTNLRFLWAYNQRTADPQAVVGKTDMDIFTPEDAEKLIALKRKVLESGKELTEEIWLNRNAKMMCLNVYIEPMRDTDGHIKGIGIATVDLTPLKLAEKELRESALKYQGLFTNIQDAVLVADDNGQYIDVNPSACRQLGFTREEFLKMSIWDITPETNKELAFDLWKEFIAKGEQSGEFLVTRKDGAKLVLDYRATANVLPGVHYSVMRDITERKQSEDALRKSVKKYRALFEVFPVGITVADKNGKILESNREAERLLGLSKEEQERRTIDGAEWKIIRTDRTIMSPEEYASVRALKEMRLIENVEMGILKENGAVTWINVNATPMDDSEVVIVYHDITERKRMHEELQKSEERYRLLFDNMTEGFALHELLFDDNGIPCDYRFLDINRAFERFTGLKRADLIGRGQREVLPDEDPFWFNAYSEVALSGEAIHLEHYSPVLQRHYEVFAYSPVKNQFATIFMDITKRKQAEDALSKSQAQLQAILDHSPILISIKDLQGNVILANRNFAVLDAPPLHELIGKNVFDLFPREVAENLWNNDLAALKAGHPLETEEVVKHKDGLWHTYFTVKFPVSIESEPPFGICALSIDITERKQVEEKLRASEEKFSNIFQHSPLMMAISDAATGAALDVNQRHLDVSGYTRAEWLEKTSLELNWLPNENRALLLEKMKAQGYVQSQDITVRAKDGRLIPVIYNGFSIEIDGRRHVVSISQDVTERKKAEEERVRLLDELEQKNKELEGLIYIASHDMRSPLVTVQGFGKNIEKTAGKF